MYEDVELDSGVAWNDVHFDDEFFPDMDRCCDGCFEDCMYGEDAPKYCQCYKQCKEEYETL